MVRSDSDQAGGLLEPCLLVAAAGILGGCQAVQGSVNLVEAAQAQAERDQRQGRAG
jgi:hypothetical protein